jgi:hypothetical protein
MPYVRDLGPFYEFREVANYIYAILSDKYFNAIIVSHAFSPLFCIQRCINKESNALNKSNSLH